MAMVLSGCTAARNALGTPVGTCYRALPVAAGAVGRQGHFAGVRLMTVHDLAHHRRLVGLADAAASEHDKANDVCVVVFSGSFTSAAVQEPVGVPTTVPRRYAVVAVTEPGDDLIGTVLVDRPPWELRDLI